MSSVVYAINFCPKVALGISFESGRLTNICFAPHSRRNEYDYGSSRNLRDGMR